MVHGRYDYPTNPFELVDVDGYCGACIEDGAMAMEVGGILTVMTWVLLFITEEMILASDGLTQPQMIVIKTVMIVVLILALEAWKMVLRSPLKEILATNSRTMS